MKRYEVILSNCNFLKRFVVDADTPEKANEQATNKLFEYYPSFAKQAFMIRNRELVNN